MAAAEPIIIHYHRDFDGMVSAAVLARILEQTKGIQSTWRGVNYDQRRNWEGFGAGERFAVVDFHFHPRAEFWFDHHPTTFLTPDLKRQYKETDRWRWDPKSPSCPPMIIKHARERWSYVPEERFLDMANWSDVVDAALYESVEQALYGDQPALRIARALLAGPAPDWSDSIVAAMKVGTLEEVASREDVERCWGRASRNRDKALHQFPPTVQSTDDGVVLYDASSNKIRRERFAAFYHHPDSLYAVGVIPTRSGFHVTAGRNPWNIHEDGLHLGEILERYEGGGHRAVGGANAPSLQDARRIAGEVARLLRESLSSGAASA